MQTQKNLVKCKLKKKVFQVYTINPRKLWYSIPMETNTTPAHPSLMANDCYHDGDVVDTMRPRIRGERIPEVWQVAHRSPANRTWTMTGVCFFTSQDAALRATSRMLREYPKLWIDAEFIAVKVIWLS